MSRVVPVSSTVNGEKSFDNANRQREGRYGGVGA